MRISIYAKGCALALACSTFCAPALAQDRERYATPAHDGDVFYLMDADQLNGDFGSAYGALLKVRPPPKRALLIRPRASFVQEMLKSVENI